MAVIEKVSRNLRVLQREIFRSSSVAKEEICKDILEKLRETAQIYIVEHDYPISVSKFVFKMLDDKRREMARRKGIPEPQYEFEDLFVYLLGRP